MIFVKETLNIKTHFLIQEKETALKKRKKRKKGKKRDKFTRL